jgi:hypothetical protein
MTKHLLDYMMVILALLIQEQVLEQERVLVLLGLVLVMG